MTQPCYVPDGVYSIAVVEYRWFCAICGAVEVESWQVPAGGSIPAPDRLPSNGWRVVDNGYASILVCPKHTITVTVDGSQFNHTDPLKEEENAPTIR